MRKIRALRLIEYVLWALGIVLVGSYVWVYADRTAHEAYNEWAFDRTLRKEPAPVWGYVLHLLHSRSGQPAASRQQGEAYPPPPQPAPPPRVVALAPGSVIGRMEIPRLGVRVMVLESADSDVLRVGAGHIPGTPLPGQPGNVGIAAHRDTFFRPLRNIRKNDEIEITTLDGAYRYRVQSVRIVRPTDVEVLKSDGTDELTLVTCYPFYYIGSAPKRFIVTAQRLLPQTAGASQPEPVTPPPKQGS